MNQSIRINDFSSNFLNLFASFLVLQRVNVNILLLPQRAIVLSLSLLFAIAFKSDNYHCRSWKSDNFIGRNREKEFIINLFFLGDLCLACCTLDSREDLNLEVLHSPLPAFSGHSLETMKPLLGIVWKQNEPSCWHSPETIKPFLCIVKKQ